MAACRRITQLRLKWENPVGYIGTENAPMPKNCLMLGIYIIVAYRKEALDEMAKN